jgi:hypothetical protein
MKITIPIRTVSAANAHELPFVRARRTKSERASTWGAWMAMPNAERCAARKLKSWRITLTRCTPGSRRLDDDNLPPALKGIRDEIARQLAVDDGDPRIEWRYAQQRSAWAVLVDIEEGGTRAD